MANVGSHVKDQAGWPVRLTDADVLRKPARDTTRLRNVACAPCPIRTPAARVPLRLRPNKGGRRMRKRRRENTKLALTDYDVPNEAIKGPLAAPPPLPAATTAILARIRVAREAAGDVTPERLAQDESFWSVVQQAYDVDRSILNLNNAGVAPAPRIVLESMYRYVEFANHAPSRNLWTILDPCVDTVRKRLAEHFGCDTEELAITRNASESMEICLLGLDLERGDEILCMSHEYPRMMSTLHQRALRRGIVIKTFPIPTPPDDPMELVRLFERHLTPRTKVILVAHLMFRTGQIVPIKPITEMGRERGIEVIVDGAQSFGHIECRRDKLGCDYFGTSLHKWLSAPIGTGMLYVRREKIEKLWALTPAEKPTSGDIRKFEEIGTHPTGPQLAIHEALDLFEAIGPANKTARLRYLRDRWAKRLEHVPGARLYTSLDEAQSAGMATIGIESLSAPDLARRLLDEHGIVVASIEHEQIDGIRVTANTYTTPAEIDRFCEAVERLAR